MKIISDVKQMQREAEQIRRQGEKIAFVPTMGYLHQGHLSLMDLAREKADKVVVSIFVNPTQFGPKEDLDKYPADFEGDRGKCLLKGVDIIFCPSAEQMYGADFQTFVGVEKITRELCGKTRPIHFRGVCTVVLKLFNLVKPHLAVFGEKDFQQLLTIKKMAEDLHLEIEIVGAPIVREQDRLAMSSRNAYLKPAQRKLARELYATLTQINQALAKGNLQVAALLQLGRRHLAQFEQLELDYLEIFGQNLESVEVIKNPCRAFIAVIIGQTRLIDNMALIPPPDCK